MSQIGASHFGAFAQQPFSKACSNKCKRMLVAVTAEGIELSRRTR